MKICELITINFILKWKIDYLIIYLKSEKVDQIQWNICIYPHDHYIYLIWKTMRKKWGKFSFRLYPQLFIGGLMSWLRYLRLFTQGIVFFHIHPIVHEPSYKQLGVKTKWKFASFLTHGLPDDVYIVIMRIYTDIPLDLVDFFRFQIYD
jgi:hypothetical protein